jgi:hypothetical protein
MVPKGMARRKRGIVPVGQEAFALPPDALVVATCTRVERAHAESRTVDDGSERLAQPGRATGVCG